MRTWRQGAVGVIELPGSPAIYVRCLKYPLGLFCHGLDSDTPAFGKDSLLAFVELGALRRIDRIAFSPLSAEERRLCERMTVRHVSGSVGIEELDFKPGPGSSRLLNPGRASTIEEIQESLSLGRR